MEEVGENGLLLSTLSHINSSHPATMVILVFRPETLLLLLLFELLLLASQLLLSELVFGAPLPFEEDSFLKASSLAASCSLKRLLATRPLSGSKLSSSWLRRART